MAQGSFAKLLYPVDEIKHVSSSSNVHMQKKEQSTAQLTKTTKIFWEKGWEASLMDICRDMRDWGYRWEERDTIEP